MVGRADCICAASVQVCAYTVIGLNPLDTKCSVVIYSRRVSDLIQNSRRLVCSGRVIVIQTGGVVRMSLPETTGIKRADSDYP